MVVKMKQTKKAKLANKVLNSFNWPMKRNKHETSLLYNMTFDALSSYSNDDDLRELCMELTRIAGRGKYPSHFGCMIRAIQNFFG